MDMKELFREDPLEWCLSQMQGAPDKQTNFDHAMLFAFLENHLASSDMEERARVDDVLYRKLSDLAAFHETLVSVRLHRPQNKARDIDEVIKSEDREAWKIKSVPISFDAKDTSVLGTPLFNNFYKAPLPSGLKNTTWLRRSRAIRKALEDFWKGHREHFQRDFEKSDLSTQEISNILEVISANRSPEYIESVQVEQEQVLTNIERASVTTSASLQKDWVSSHMTHSAMPVPKSQIKKRMAKQPEDTKITEDEESSVTGPIEESPLEIPVTRRAFDVFTLMFPTSAEEASKGVEWDRFVLAMSDVGFAARNGGGSVVIFENESLDTEGHDGGKIIFHKPHPVAKIDSVMLHSMGKRMGKWFHWSRDCFVLQS
ncbi:hypothetical protein MMC14_009971 [Varicellaria rhodocarpa]|nr:hypothetical protein [Varicellaria rhodocarpa]